MSQGDQGSGTLRALGFTIFVLPSFILGHEVKRTSTPRALGSIRTLVFRTFYPNPGGGGRGTLKTLFSWHCAKREEGGGVGGGAGDQNKFQRGCQRQQQQLGGCDWCWNLSLEISWRMPLSSQAGIADKHLAVTPLVMSTVLTKKQNTYLISKARTKSLTTGD